ncbi:MAG TPA: tetratricopeptide repeat protein [Candidatus Binatia bacterium]
MRNRGAFPLFMGVSMSLFLGAVAYGGAPTASPEKLTGNYQGPVAERPSHESGDYWIYVKPGGDRFRVESGNIMLNVEFPLRVGGIWKYRSGALYEGQPQTSKATRATVEIACEATAFKTVTVAAGSFEAFECRCECNVIGRAGRDKICGEWILWYAPRVKNVIKTKAESTANTFELADYNIRDHLAQPKTAQDFYNRGLGYRRKKEYDRAIQDFAEAIRSNSNYADAFNSRGLAYADKKDYDRAIQDYNEALRLNPTHVFAFNNRGNAYLDKKQSDLAIADYDRAIAYDSNYSTAYFNRARAYSAKKDDERALQDYEMAIRINPKYAAALYNRGNIYRAKKDYNRAIKDYDEAIRSNPADAMTFNNRGIAYRDKGDDERAMADYDQAIQLKPDYALAFSNRGNIFRSRGDYDRAIQDYDAAVRLDPNYAAAFGNRGRARFYQGRFDAAVLDLAKAFDLQPSSLYHAVWLYLAETRAGQNGRPGLESRAPRLNLKNWPGPVINFYLGKIDEVAMYAAAEDVDAKKRSERICEANFFAAEGKVLKGAVAEAVPLLRAAAEDCPPNFTAKSGARAELKRLGQ